MEPRVRRADYDVRHRDEILPQPMGRWTRRCVLFSPYRALKIRKAGICMCFCGVDCYLKMLVSALPHPLLVEELGACGWRLLCLLKFVCFTE